jgi:hypothetical protein
VEQEPPVRVFGRRLRLEPAGRQGQTTMSKRNYLKKRNLLGSFGIRQQVKMTETDRPRSWATVAEA